MQALNDPVRQTTSAIFELAHPPRRADDLFQRLRRLGRTLERHRWDLAYLPVPAIPIATLFLLLHARYWELAHPRDYLAVHPQLFYALLVANALLGLGVAVWSYFLFTERRELYEQVVAHQKRGDLRGEELVRLEKEMEFLTAMRDLSRIINDDVQFEAVWTRVLEVLMSIVQCRRITIYTVDAAGAPVARILHHRGQTRFGSQIHPEELDLTNVAETLEYRSILRLAEGTQCFWTYPLMADGGVQGVLQIVAGLEGDAEEKVRRIERHEEAIRHMLKHISLALKTPTLYDRATLDGLTGLFNKQQFTSVLEAAVRTAQRAGKPFTLAMSDIDFFKAVNDTHGHLVGDRCLQVVAQVLKEQVRPTDTVFRYGGEEMAILFPDTDEEAATAIVEKVHAALAAAEIPLPGGEVLRVTASMGICQFQANASSPDAIVSSADQCLYAAKRGGRNQIWAWDGEQPRRTANSPKARLKRPKNARREGE